MLRRSGTHPHFAHHLDFPGGEVEQSEDPAEAVAREISEETRLIVEASRLKPGFQKRLSGGLTHVLFVVDLASTQPAITTSWEHDDYKWLSVNALLNESSPRNADLSYVDVIAWLSSGSVS